MGREEGDAPGIRRRRIRIHLPGVIKTLGQHLYSDNSVAIRELIQNANDSLITRRVEDEACPTDLRIEMDCDYMEDLLVVRDNGAGMTDQEITEYLSTVGKSGTDELRKTLEEQDAEEARRLIGQFGLGFLSAFVIAESVEVRTRSFKEGEPGFTWRCDGGTDYSLSESPDLPIGTEVTLHLRRDQDHFADGDHLTPIVRRFADFLSFPIYIGQTPLPINVQTAPWHSDASAAEYVDYIHRRFEEEALEVVPLRAEADEVQIGGALYIPESRRRDLGVVELYVSRMYVGPDHELLPDWAKFVGGVVESPSLDVTASREGPVRNSKYREVQALVADRLADAIGGLARDDSARFNRLVKAHEHPVKLGALEDDSFFALVKDHVEFDTDAGKMTIPQYLDRASRQSGDRVRTIYYHTGGVESRQHQLLFAANGIPVLDAEERIDQAFIEKYADQVRPVRAKEIDQASDALLNPVSSGTLEEVIGRYADMDITAKAAAFKPASVPALLAREERPRIEMLLGDPEVPELLRQMFETLTRGHRGMSGAGWTLYLNTNNAVIRLLADLERNDDVKLQCMKEIYNSAYLVAAKGLSVHEVEKMAEIHSETVAMLLTLAKEGNQQAAREGKLGFWRRLTQR